MKKIRLPITRMRNAGIMPPLSRAACFMAVIIAAAAAPPRAAPEPEGFQPEGIHMESLIAQSVGMERRFQNQNLFFEDRGAEEYLNDILETLAAPEENRQFMLRVRVLRSSSLNAFASPHGTIYVCTGLLARITNEAQAAALLAHELAHVISFHAPKNLVTLKLHARLKAQQARRGPPPPVFGVGAPGSAGGAAFAPTVNGYGRMFERDADSIGLIRMAEAGYPHREFYNLFAMLGGYIAAERIDEPYFFSSHPRITERLDNYKQIIGALGLADDIDCGGAGFSRWGDSKADAGNEAVFSEGGGSSADAGKRKGRNQTGGARAGNCMEDDIGRGYFNIKLRNVVLYDAAINQAAGRHEIVEAQLGRLLSVDSGDAAALVMRGDMERMLSPRSTDAVGWYKRALNHDPENIAALRAAGFAYHSIGDFENARVYLRKYCEIAHGAADIKMAKEALRQCGE